MSGLKQQDPNQNRDNTLDSNSICILGDLTNIHGAFTFADLVDINIKKPVILTCEKCLVKMKAEYDIFNKNIQGVSFSQFFNTSLEQQLHRIQMFKNEIESNLDQKTLIKCIAKFEKIYNRFVYIN